MLNIFAEHMRPPGNTLVPQSIAARLQQSILCGALAPGAQLPSQRELSGQFGVSRASLREAISMLATLGLVDIKPGLGVFVTHPSGRVVPWRFPHAASARHVYQARLALEGTAAGLAATCASAAALDEILATVEDIDAALARADLVAMTVADAAFHDLVVRSAANPLIESMYRSARELMVETQRAPMATHLRLAETVAEHKVILLALQARNPVAAAQAMRDHICGSARRFGIPL